MARNLRALVADLRTIVEARGVSASVQVSEPYLTYTQAGDRLVYTIWAWVSPYFGKAPAKDAIYIHTEGRTSDGIEELVERQRGLYGTRSALMHFEGREEEYPYTEKRYTGATIKDIARLKGTTVRMRDGKPAPLAEGMQVEWRGRSSGRGRDPYLMRAKKAGVDAKGLAFKAGDEIMYYPNDKTILAGANKDQAWREFAAARDDEAFMTGGY